jgi:hypothetical protein|tara:strand:+ start:185 stop:454 length:270 start_codon:yes stop_codon:yes gene_type:complete
MECKPMTKKDYIKFAKVISELQINILQDKSIERGDEYQQAYRYSLELQDNIINIFKADNPSFNESKFNDEVSKLNGTYSDYIPTDLNIR